MKPPKRPPQPPARFLQGATEEEVEEVEGVKEEGSPAAAAAAAATAAEAAAAAAAVAAPGGSPKRKGGDGDRPSSARDAHGPTQYRRVRVSGLHGNCLFRALALTEYRDANRQADIRLRIEAVRPGVVAHVGHALGGDLLAAQLQLTGTFAQAGPANWGGAIELLAASNVFRATLFIHTTRADGTEQRTFGDFFPCPCHFPPFVCVFLFGRVCLRHQIS